MGTIVASTKSGGDTSGRGDFRNGYRLRGKTGVYSLITKSFKSHVGERGVMMIYVNYFC